MHLRTTNIIERLHKEFKRRTKPMEIVAGEASVHTILAFVAMKMEMPWRNARPDARAQALRAGAAGRQRRRMNPWRHV